MLNLKGKRQPRAEARRHGTRACTAADASPRSRGSFVEDGPQRARRNCCPAGLSSSQRLLLQRDNPKRPDAVMPGSPSVPSEAVQTVFELSGQPRGLAGPQGSHRAANGKRASAPQAESARYRANHVSALTATPRSRPYPARAPSRHHRVEAISAAAWHQP